MSANSSGMEISVAVLTDNSGIIRLGRAYHTGDEVKLSFALEEIETFLDGHFDRIKFGTI